MNEEAQLTILATVNRGKLFVDVASRARKRKTQGTSVGSLSEFRHGGAAPDAPNQRSIKQSPPILAGAGSRLSTRPPSETVHHKF